MGTLCTITLTQWLIIIGLVVISIATTIGVGIAEANASKRDYEVKHIVRDVLFGLCGFGIAVDVVAVVELLGALMLGLLFLIALFVWWAILPIQPFLHKKIIKNQSDNSCES